MAKYEMTEEEVEAVGLALTSFILMCGSEERDLSVDLRQIDDLVPVASRLLDRVMGWIDGNRS